MIDYAEMSRADAAAQLDYALEQGLEQGRAQGVEWGRNEESLHIARNALSKGLPIELIGTITGLSPDAIRRLQENN
jgi:predicted transposase/invertase (TIGR01784 family)